MSAHRVNVQEAIFMRDSVKITLDNGQEKFLSHTTFASALLKCISGVDDSNKSQLLLPSNVFYLEQSVAAVRLSCYYKGGVRKVKYLNDSYDMVLPNIIVSHTLNREGDTLSMVYSRYFCTDLNPGALKREFINEVDAQNHIFLLPMSNTYGDGKMCYGGNQMPMQFKEGNLRSLDWYFQYLFESPFNNDLGISAVGAYESVGKWYKTLAKAAKNGEEFPYSRLSGYTPLTSTV